MLTFSTARMIEYCESMHDECRLTDRTLSALSARRTHSLVAVSPHAPELSGLLAVQEHVNCIPGQEDWQMSVTKNEVGCHSLVTIAFKPEPEGGLPI